MKASSPHSMCLAFAVAISLVALATAQIQTTGTRRTRRDDHG